MLAITLVKVVKILPRRTTGTCATHQRVLAHAIKRAREIFHDKPTWATLMERGAALTRAFASKEAALGQAEETVAARDERIASLEALLTSETQAAEQAIEELTVALRREKVERAVAEGALESGRKDFARLMRELMALQHGRDAAEEPAALRPANAA